jgi:hypothetical protein
MPAPPYATSSRWSAGAIRRPAECARPLLSGLAFRYWAQSYGYVCLADHPAIDLGHCGAGQRDHLLPASGPRGFCVSVSPNRRRGEARALEPTGAVAGGVAQSDMGGGGSVAVELCSAGWMRASARPRIDRNVVVERVAFEPSVPSRQLSLASPPPPPLSIRPPAHWARFWEATIFAKTSPQRPSQDD